MSSPGRPTLSVVVPVHNGGTKFRRCLQSLTESTSAPEEIIVVSDGDTDGSWQVAEEFGARVLRTATPQGPATARNLGAGAASGEILFFVDADVTLPRDSMSKVEAAFQHDPELAAVFGSYDDEPSERNFLSQYKNLSHHYIHQTANEEASTFWTACGAIRREIFLEIGGFDTGYRRPSIEDIDLGYRLKKAGYRIRLLKELQVKHLKRWGFFSLLQADFCCRALPWTYLILKEGRFIDDLNVKLSSRISVILVYLLLSTLFWALWISRLIVPAFLLIIGLLALNWDLYRFFWHKRGLGFAAKTVFWHWLYFLYSGLAFAIGFVRYRMRKLTV